MKYFRKVYFLDLENIYFDFNKFIRLIVLRSKNCDPAIKTEGRISLWHNSICCHEVWYIIIPLSADLKTSSSFCPPVLTHNVICLPFLFLVLFGPLKNSFLFCRPARWKYHLSFADPTRWKKSSLICRPEPGTGHGPVQTSNKDQPLKMWFSGSGALYIQNV